MPLTDCDFRKEEMIDGVIYDMSPSAGYQHSLINGNIYAKLRASTKGSLCLPFIENLDYHYDKDKNYVIPDVIIVCDRKELKGDGYYGTPKFIAETLSPGTATRDRRTKMEIYERCGVFEYWIISPKEKGIERYYLEDGHYVLQEAYILETDEKSKHYNAKDEITLREFPVNMLLEEIFEGLE